ncbi:MAG: hypothetical protein Q8R78_02480 [Candidatus Omnitrophota bacterium]|nr:hypothetical protein [Candidatus Omnitrophota bacterium]
MEKNRWEFSIDDFRLTIGKRHREKGQSIIEYLLVATAVIAGIVAFSLNIDDKVTALGNSAGGQIDAAGQTITTTVVATEH